MNEQSNQTGGAASSRPAKRHNWLEIVATLLLSVAAVATAWAGYQATRWNGEQARAASRTNALRSEGARAQGLAESETEVDVATFIQWVDATAKDEDELAAFYVERFRPDFAAAFEEWVALEPLTTPGAPPSPFAMDDYRSAATAKTAAIDAEAEASAAKVSTDIQRASNYVLTVVLMSVALFFAGISTKLTAPRLRVIALAIGCTVFIGAAIWMATFPISISV